MSGPFGAIAMVLAFVVGFILPFAVADRINLWGVTLIAFGAGVCLGLTGSLLDFAFGTHW